MKISAMSHEPTPDWVTLRNEVPEVAAKRLQGILVSLDANEKKVFAWRGMAALLIEERGLHRFVVDEEAGDYYQSFDKWLKDTCPNSWSYVRDALRAVKELKDVPFDDLLQMKRCNIQHLKSVSSNVRALPEVIEAAKKMPEKDLVSALNHKYDQHLEMKQPVPMAPSGDVEEFEEAIALAMELEGCSRQEAIRAIAVNYLVDHRPEMEYRKIQAEMRA